MLGAEHAHRVLITDDEAHVAGILARWLSDAGYQCETANCADEAWRLLTGGDFSLLVSDINMPGRSGMELLQLVREEFPDLAVIMVTAVDDRQTAIRALELGAFGYTIKPFDQNEILITAASALERRRLGLEARAYELYLEDEVRKRTSDLREREEAITLHLLSAAEMRDEETGAHVRRIGLYCAALAANLGWKASSADDLRVAAPMHDIGKIGVPDAVLRKPGPLDAHETETMRTHAQLGSQMLYNAKVPLLQLAADIARTHHERWDGTGYPRRIAGVEIPECGRLVALADVYDALVHDRVYRPALPEDEALGVMVRGRGTHFDPVVYDCFMDTLPRLRAIRAELPDPPTSGPDATSQE
jgi:putative two-component system response regulator